ncbi:hypothetical protein TraAM80_05737 [Trypanosoma rangeli]|uniref:Uncharacterized protein n=1 Tax=Trypanosoma rangeli TaxID=5698 RepID=A0A3R7KC68_TRYRA|nr:uncharacterized protein TraAM80_05737 [Trypanosoma rangeli]RNF03578.1 hypothetical protein TraAM80_05737 [Trypanosoma rangeli]|eukprot:RNF03578.1 hypothetical protein TraAM80_05737 [Trypanosoma rangeli]
MIDITAVPARTVTCPFPLLAHDAAVPQDSLTSPLLLLLMGREKACVAVLQDHKICLRRFILQSHRTLTACAFRPINANDEHIFALADTFATLTLHRFSQASNRVSPVDQDSGTIFVGNAWDTTPRIDQVVPVRDSSGVDAVCTRQGETNAAWAISFEREEAHTIKVDGTLERLFVQQQVTSGCFVGTTRRGVSLISPASGETLMELRLPDGEGHVTAVQSGVAGSGYYAVVTTCGTALMYDQRRAEKPFWSEPLWDLRDVKDAGNAETLMAYCCEGVWAVRAAEKLHCLRCTDGSVVCRSFPLSGGFHSSHFATAGLYFTDDVLHFVGSKGV